MYHRIHCHQKVAYKDQYRLQIDRVLYVQFILRVLWHNEPDFAHYSQHFGTIHDSCRCYLCSVRRRLFRVFARNTRFEVIHHIQVFCVSNVIGDDQYFHRHFNSVARRQ